MGSQDVQDADTGVYLIDMRIVIVEHGRVEAERQRAEQSLADERDAHEETRTALTG